MSKKTFGISVGSADEYDDLIAEIHFENKAGIIVSQEKGPGEFEISVHSLIENAANDFDFCRNNAAAKIPLAEFRKAVEAAVNELTRLKKS